jgi:predicted aldo/keto reductase-like oxidoreductase
MNLYRADGEACPDDLGGESEIRMGKALKDGYRQKALLMTKIDGQTKQAAARQIDECLRRLQTDLIDLMQLHEIIRPADPDRIFGPKGAHEAAAQGRFERYKTTDQFDGTAHNPHWLG